MTGLEWVVQILLSMAGMIGGVIIAIIIAWVLTGKIHYPSITWKKWKSHERE